MAEENPYKLFEGLSNSEKNYKIIENIIKSIKLDNSDTNINEVSKKFKEIKCNNLRDTEAKQNAIYYITLKTRSSTFREKNDFTINY